VKKIIFIFIITLTAYSACTKSTGGSSNNVVKDTTGGLSDNNINNIVNDIRNNPIDLSIKKYNLTSKAIGQMNNFANFGWYMDTDRDIKSYNNNYLMIQYFDSSWYIVNRFAFNKFGMSLDNGIVIVFNENKILIEIHINFAKVNIDKDISKILINEWKTYPTHYPQWKLLFSNDNTFSFTYKLKTEDEYIINKGIWRVVFDNDYPKVELIFDDEKEFNYRYKIDELQENEFRIDFGSIYFFYPYTFNYP